MKLQNNPFYILHLGCGASRREIVSAAEEMSFLRDPELCAEAQNNLINLTKRLAAELSWFLDVDGERLEDIRMCIEQGRRISSVGLEPLSAFNTELYNFSLKTQADPRSLQENILELDRQFSALDTEKITRRVNVGRSAAKLALVNGQDVLNELEKRRTEIRQIVDEKLSVLDREAYIDLVTTLAEQYIAQKDYDDGEVLSDVIDQYEIRMQSGLEEKTAAVEEYIERVKQLAQRSDVNLGESIQTLIRKTQDWDRVAQPLQLKAQASGVPHQVSEKLGQELRGLVLCLHNELSKTNEALILVKAMRDVFAELGSLSDRLQIDLDALKNLLENKQAAGEIKREIDILGERSNGLKAHTSESGTKDFIEVVQRLNAKVKALITDDVEQKKLREYVYYFARNTAICLHNEKNATPYALMIMKALVTEFGDLPSLNASMVQDIGTLSGQMVVYEHNEQVQKRKKEKAKGVLLFWAFIIVLAIIVNAVPDSSSKSSSRSGTSTYTSGSSVNTSSQVTTAVATATPKPTATPKSQVAFNVDEASIGDSVYVDIVSIFPSIGIYNEGSTGYTNYACECLTDEGDTVWLYISRWEYILNFDVAVPTSVDSSDGAEEVTFDEPKRVYGIVRSANNLVEGLSEDTGELVVRFTSSD
jgi:hypothetical protein